MSKMSILKTLPITEVEPGMILAKRLLCPEKGGVLLGAGIKITDKVKEVLKKKYPDLKLEVQVPVEVSDEEITETVESKEQSTGTKLPTEIKELKILDSFPKKMISTSARQCFVNFSVALKNFYETGEENEWRALKRSISELVNQIIKTPRSMQQIVALRLIQNYTISHAVNTTIYSLFIGKAMGLSIDRLYNLGLAAALADIGLIKVPAKIRDKKANLTTEEWHILKQHVNHSGASARRYRLNEDVKNAIFQHHERNDGSGYPFGIKEKDIHLWAQIIAVADTYDAIVSERPYRKAEPAFAATEILMAHCNKLNPKIIAVFLKNVSVYPQKGKIRLSNDKQGEIIYLNKLYPDRPIVMVHSENDFMGRRYIDLTKDLTLFVEDVD